jgi:tetratricopeptide (TPR) repeat protein
MKPRTLLIGIALAAGVLFVTPGEACTQNQSSAQGRWDLQMIREAPIWTKLLVRYTDSDHLGAWPQRKAALESLLREHPDSRWADDAAMLLACGRASLEGDLNGAIGDLERIVERYPEGQTVVDRWDLERGCLLDETWLLWQGGLAFLDKDGRIRTAKPFDRDGEISAGEREALAYFDHLEKYPRATSVMARLLIAELQAHSGNPSASIKTLLDLVTDADAYLRLITRADRAVGRSADGYHVRNLVNRPEYGAYIYLARQYVKQRQSDQAIEIADRFVERYSQDGWLWPMHRQLADIYARSGRYEQAERQRTLALQGLSAHEKTIRKRDQRVGGSDLGDQYWDLERQRINAMRIEPKKAQ